MQKGGGMHSAMWALAGASTALTSAWATNSSYLLQCDSPFSTTGFSKSNAGLVGIKSMVTEDTEPA